MASGTDRGDTGTSERATVGVTGAAGALGRRVCALAAADPAVGRIVAVDRRPVRGIAGPVRAVEVDLSVADLKPVFEGADVVIHLAQPDGPSRDAVGAAAAGDARIAHRVLEAASAVGATHLVLLSSALTYGAWANNPVPLTEDAPLRPNPGVTAACEKAEVERAAAEWRDDHPGTTVAVLRPTVTLAPEGSGWLARALARGSAPVSPEEPPAQFLDVGDLATAVDLARSARLDGPRNVAPDGWIDADTARALAGGVPRVRLPERLALRVAGLRWRLGLGATPPELLPYTVHPWVVANDRLRSDGWKPTSSNEEAFVAHNAAGPWATVSPRRRQELALAASGAVLLAGVLSVVAVARRRRRRS